MNTPFPPRPANRNLLLLLLGLPALAMVAASCTTGDGSVSAEAPTSFTVPVSPITATPMTPPPITEAPTTVAPATDAPTTTEVPTTLPPTTEAPTTTVAPTTTLPPNVDIVPVLATPLVAVGTRDGEATKLVQTRLLELGFWNAGADGEYGLTTKQAVMAFQKYLGLESSGSVDETTAAYLSNFGERGHGTADTGDLIEVDKVKQLLFIIRGGKTVWTFNTSTGNGKEYTEEDKNTPGEIVTGVSLTPDGLWNVNRERPEGWWEGDLGQIYRPKYFRGGVAVHGSNTIPNYPASHGCVRLSVPAMDFIWDQDLMPMKSTVWVHGG